MVKGAQTTEEDQSSTDEEEEEITKEEITRTHLGALQNKLAWVEGLTVDQKFQELHSNALHQDECKESTAQFFTQLDKYPDDTSEVGQIPKNPPRRWRPGESL